MPHKSRFTLEEKKQAVEECIAGKESVNGCATKRKIPYSTLLGWIRLYQMRGIEGLISSGSNRKYSPEIKLLAVEEYQLGGCSQSSICKKYNISDSKMFRQWIKQYNNHGEFNQPNSGGATYMVKGRDTTYDERIEIISFCIANNKDYGKTIEHYNVSYQQIYGWVRKYENDGVDGLVDRRGKRKDESSMNEVERLRAQLKLKEAENLRLQIENELLKKLEEIERRRSQD